MAVSSIINRNNYIGSGSTATYGYGFKIFANTDLQVIVRLISTGAETTLTLTTDYTVSNVGVLAGGNVVLVDADQAWLDSSGYLLATYEISIRRVMPLKQLTAYRNLAAFYPEEHENSFDKDVMIAQQQQDQIDRSIRFPDSVDPDDFDPELPASIVGEANKIIITNSTGTGFLSAEITDVEATPQVVGSTASPTAIVAATGILFSGSYWNNFYFITGSGGPINVTAAARIAAGTNVGQVLTIIGCDDTNYVDLTDGQGLRTAGQTIRHFNGTISKWLWTGAAWTLISSNGFVA